MAKTLAQIEKQIAALKREADEIRNKEVAGVVSRIREAIEHYGLTPAELFSQKAAGRKAEPGVGKAAKRVAGNTVAKTPSPPKYRDGAGRTWTGNGKSPGWFKDAIAAGKTPADLEIKA